MSNKIEKYVKDGKVAVLVSHGYGAGWYTWNSGDSADRLLYDPIIVDLVLNNPPNLENQVRDHIDANYDDEYICILGLDGLTVHWVPLGTRFRIEEYDGAESLITLKDEIYLVA